VIGCAIARRAARDGLSVVVIERGTPGMEASWAAAADVAGFGIGRFGAGGGGSVERCGFGGMIRIRRGDAESAEVRMIRRGIVPSALQSE
jgi:glycine/D-amino acid oxidase-like deaminating enzyme